MPGQPDLVELLAREPGFAGAVGARSARDAAAAALAVIRSNWRIFGPGLRPANAPPPISLGHPHPHSHHAHHPHHTHEPSAPGAAARRPSDSGAATAAAGPAAAPAAAPAAPGLGPSGSAPAQSGGVGLARQAGRPVERQQSVFRARGPLKLKDFIKLMRKELAATEEQVPWSLVENRWRAQRKNWQRRVRQADTIQGLAGCIWELHGTLRTDKAAGLFASGGQWERSLLQVVNGLGNQLQLQTVWEEMRGLLQSWLEKQQLPGSSASLDKASYAQAVRTFNVLQEAAVPLDQILGSQRELQALQAIILREHAAMQARLQETATGGEGGGGGGGSGGATAMLTDPAAAPDGLLATIGKLPGVRGADDDDVDTDGDLCSEATDMDDSE